MVREPRPGKCLMNSVQLHADSAVIDRLIIAKWRRELFEYLCKRGL